MKLFAIRIMKGVLAAIYACMKAACPQRARRVVFLTRQSNEVQLDFQMLMDALDGLDEPVEYTAICCRSDKDVASLARYVGATFRSMYWLATSRVAVLNSYWPVASMLNHRENLKVIQIWHAAGKIKQSGYQTLGRDMGHSALVAREMGMHQGYDVVIAGARAWNPFYCASFGIEEEKIANVGLPRFDFLQQDPTPVRERFFARYPETAGRRIVLYAPTFRSGLTAGAEAIVRELTRDPENVVIFRRHPNQKPVALNSKSVYRAQEFSSLELLLVADYLITDYSAIAVEAASVGLRTLYYCFDIEDYIARNGLNLDPRDSMPSCVYTDAAALADSLHEPYPEEEFSAYCDAYVLPAEDLGHSTERILNMIEEGMAA